MLTNILQLLWYRVEYAEEHTGTRFNTSETSLPKHPSFTSQRDKFSKHPYT